MQLYAYKNTERTARFPPPTAMESKVAFLEKRQRELTAELKRLVKDRENAVKRITSARNQALAKFESDKQVWSMTITEMYQKRDALMTEISIIERKHADITKEWSPPVRGSYSPSVLRVSDRICAAFNITFSDLIGNGRGARLVLARHAFCYWASRRTQLSQSQIGAILGGRDHSTVVHGKYAYVEKRARMGRRLREVR